MYENVKTWNPFKGCLFDCVYCRPSFQKQSKYFAPFLSDVPTNAIILTTLETNRDKGYRQISKAPVLSVRYNQLRNLDYPRKVMTIEPVLDFDLDVFVDWIKSIDPEYVWLGYNSRPKQVQMPEPDEEKMVRFIIELRKNNIPIQAKDLRNLNDRIQRPQGLLKQLKS